MENWKNAGNFSGQRKLGKGQGKIFSGKVRENEKLMPPDVIFRLKCVRFDFRWGSAPDPTGGAYSDPLIS